MKKFLVCLLVLAGCAAPMQKGQRENPASPVIPPHAFRGLIVYVPQTDDAAAMWLKWFVKYPQLRMVIAMSPRFNRIAKDPHLKTQFQALIKQRRLDLALQIPNAPILPLLMEDPPYGFSDDVVQLIAQTKADFFRQWNFLPRALVLPFGATSPKLLSLVEKLGFSWLVAALGVPPVDGPSQSGSLTLWDGVSRKIPPLTAVYVWDERDMKGIPLDAWVREINEKGGAFILPTDSGIVSVPIGSEAAFMPRTWSLPDWSLWIGRPDKNAAWSALKKTRQALEAYKNSGLASVQRLDAAFEEIYSAQNSNYFAAIGNTSLSPALAEEREHEFQATLLTVYRLIGQPPPEDLFKSAAPGAASSIYVTSTTARAESFPDGREHVSIEDAIGDALVPGGPDLKSLEVWASTTDTRWMVTLASTVTATIDIYVDLNGQPNAGTPTFLQGRPYATAPADAWEYALSLAGTTATLYRTQGAGTYGTVQSFPVAGQGTSYSVIIPRDLLRGSPKRWGYQVLVMSGAAISDFIDPYDVSQKDLWQDLSTGKRGDIPFVRVRQK